jgi:hypothetical protein
MYNKSAINDLQNHINKAVDKVFQDIVDDFPKIQGREEEITSQFRGEINRHLIHEIEKSLGGIKLNDFKIDVYTYSPKEEHSTGADIAGILEIDYGSKKLKKAFLAQSKICYPITVKSSTGTSAPHYKAKNSLILKQAKDMLNITSDSFFFLYTKTGCFVIPALHVDAIGKDEVNTVDFHYKKLGNFYSEFFQCFIGDHKIADIATDSKSLKDYAAKYNVNNVLYIKINTTLDDKE